MKTAGTIIVIGALAAALGACTPYRQQEEAGMVIGGIVGGMLGSQIGHGSGRAAATGLGVVIGAMVGGNIGRQMDANDRRYAMLALENVRTGVPSSWRNPDTGYRYEVVPNRTYYPSPDAPCREYTVTATIGGHRDTVHGTACRQPDGSWRAVN
jgi:surface antigen